MKTKFIFQQILIVAIIILLPAILHAQPSLPETTIDAPIDGGLSLLIAGGLGYGVKKIREKRKMQKEVQKNK